MNANFAKKDKIIFDDNGIKVKITKNVLDILYKYVQVEGKYEAGGILIAREDIENNNIIIDFATEPFDKDIRKRCSFIRKDRRHIEICNKTYTESNNRYAYIGEWHTHPEKYPTPSFIDKTSWRRNWKEKNDGVLYNIIVGTEEIRIWRTEKRIQRVMEENKNE